MQSMCLVCGGHHDRMVSRCDHCGQRDGSKFARRITLDDQPQHTYMRGGLTMSIVEQYLCDRCGDRTDVRREGDNVIPKQSEDDITHRKTWSSLQISPSSAFGREETLHLCLECMAALRKFVGECMEEESVSDA